MPALPKHPTWTTWNTDLKNSLVWFTFLCSHPDDDDRENIFPVNYWMSRRVDEGRMSKHQYCLQTISMGHISLALILKCAAMFSRAWSRSIKSLVIDSCQVCMSTASCILSASLSTSSTEDSIKHVSPILISHNSRASWTPLGLLLTHRQILTAIQLKTRIKLGPPCRLLEYKLNTLLRIHSQCHCMLPWTYGSSKTRELNT